MSICSKVCLSIVSNLIVYFNRKLGEAQQLVSDIGLRILVSYNRTRQLQKLICSLQTIKMLHETDFQLRQLIEVIELYRINRQEYISRKAIFRLQFDCVWKRAKRHRHTIISHASGNF
jgi:hypothetical protein